MQDRSTGYIEIFCWEGQNFYEVVVPKEEEDNILLAFQRELATFEFCGGQNGIWVGFSQGFFHFPPPQISFHHFSTLILLILFHFLSSAPVMVLQTWLADIFTIHRPSVKGVHCITALNLVQYWTRVEDVYWFYIPNKNGRGDRAASGTYLRQTIGVVGSAGERRKM